MYFEKEIDVPNASWLAEHAPEEFAKIRRQGFGTSDSSILLGVNHWTTLDNLIEQKNCDTLTPEEIAIGDKPQVRMGRDLEPLVLDKFKAWAEEPNISKPAAQYRLIDLPMLTVNYDALWGTVPVEIKTISTFAYKYWDFDKAMLSVDQEPQPQSYGSAHSIKEKIEMQAKMVGIPPYYYTQVQQQLLGTPATHAYLAALNIKDWTLYVFRIVEDEEIQHELINTATKRAFDCKFIAPLLNN